MRNDLKSIFSLIIIFCLINSSLAGKRKRNEPGESSSSSQAAKFVDRPQTKLSTLILNPDHKNNALDLIEYIDAFELDCTPKILIKFKHQDQLTTTKFIKRCFSQFNEWSQYKTWKLDQFGTMIHRWFAMIVKFLDISEENLNLILQEDLRNHHDQPFSRIIRNTRRVTEAKIRNNQKSFDTEVLENSERGYYFGEGICVHILEPPFDRVEAFMKTVLKEFQHLDYVKNFKIKVQKPTSLQIYIFQKVCRRHNEKPWNPPNVDLAITDIESINSIKLVKFSLHEASEEMKSDELRDGINCDWPEVFKRKQQYRILYLLRGHKDFFKNKQVADKMIDNFVAYCLSKIANNRDITQVYENIKGTPEEHLLPLMANRLSDLLEFYQLPLDKSINNALDVRSPSSKLKVNIIEEIKNLIFNHNSKLAKHFADLLLGNLGHFYSGIFAEPIYKVRQSVEYKLLEFLFHIFSIKGYKPQFKSPLLEFYYLYKISEICYMIPVDELKFISSILTEDKQRRELLFHEHDQKTSLDLFEQVSNEQSDMATTSYHNNPAINLIDWINTFALDCSPSSLLILRNFGDEVVTAFLDACDNQSKQWLDKKVEDLDFIGTMINRWLSNITSFRKLSAKNLYLLLSEDPRSEIPFKKRIRETWTPRELRDGSKNLTPEGQEYSRSTYYFGDGICVHILAPPFDKIEKFIQLVLKEFKHLQYVQDLSQHYYGQVPTNVDIYILQQMCRTFYKNPKNPSNYPVIPAKSLSRFRPLDNNFHSCLYYVKKLRKLERETEDSCDWFAVFSRKYEYRIFEHILTHEDYQMIKDAYDQSTDMFLERCLQNFSTQDGIHRIHDKVSGAPINKSSMPEIIGHLRSALDLYQLPLDQSINNALDMRSPSNAFRGHITTIVKNIIRINEANELGELFADILLGNSSKIDQESVYRNKDLVEFKLIEFLVRVFSIQGYKPRISNFMLDFYYLYKISEICNLTPVDNMEFVVSSLNHEVQHDSADSSPSETNNSEHGQTSVTRRVLREDTLEDILHHVEAIENFNPVCTIEKLIEFENLAEQASQDEVADFLDTCDFQVQTWFDKKIQKLEIYGKMIERWLGHIEKFNLQSPLNLSFMLNEELSIPSHEVLATNFRNSFQLKLAKGRVQYINIEEKASARLAYYYGDGICMFLLLPPFDMVEKFMSIVLKDVWHLFYIRKFEQNVLSISMKIFIFQRMCRKSFAIPRISAELESIGPIDEIERANSIELAREIAETNLLTIKWMEQSDHRCDWYTNYFVRQEYRVLELLRGTKHFEKLKIDVDAELDKIVEKCLPVISREKVIRMYIRFRGKEVENLLLLVLDEFWMSVSLYELEVDQSINDALDIRSSNNKFKKFFFERIKKMITIYPNELELAYIFSDILQGNLGDFVEGIFSEPVSKEKNLEFKPMEFLSQIFSIKGYKPRPEIENALIDFYYLFKISEICNMTPFHQVDL